MTLIKGEGEAFKQCLAENGTQFYVGKSDKLSQALVSFSFKAGHFFDPDDCHGLAHLLEHLVFMGSTHLPEHNEIIDKIKTWGGSVNAWTAGEFCNYHFACHPQHLSNALSAFIDALSHPLLTLNSIEKEIQAIDAEFAFKQKDDLRRLYQIHKETCNPNHPFSKFSVGNADIYRQFNVEELQTKLRRFHQAHYHCKNLRMVICSPLESEDVVSFAKTALQQFSTGEEPVSQWPPLYLDANLKLRIDIKPLQSARRLIVTFAILRNVHELHDALSFISHILGDEGKGSLLAFLRENNWASNLIAGSGIEGSGFKDFNVSIQLTEKGEAHVKHIVAAIFCVLSRLKQDKQTWRWEEKQTLDKLATTYNDAPPTLDSICELAEATWYESLNEEHKANVSTLSEALSFFTTDNLRIKLISPTVKTTKSCAYYHAHYADHPIAKEDIAYWSSHHNIEELQLPASNHYVIQQPSVSPRESKLALPSLFVEQAHHKVWFSQEQLFNSVKGDIYSAFDAASFTETLEGAMYKRIWLHCITNTLKEDYYRAGIAGLHYRLYGHQAGFTLHCSGLLNH